MYCNFLLCTKKYQGALRNGCYIWRNHKTYPPSLPAAAARKLRMELSSRTASKDTHYVTLYPPLLLWQRRALSPPPPPNVYWCSKRATWPTLLAKYGSIRTPSSPPRPLGNIALIVLLGIDTKIDTIRYETKRNDTIRYDTIWYEKVFEKREGAR